MSLLIVSMKTLESNPSRMVSVIIPAYNAETTIATTLQSLLLQTFYNWEAIVINDGSTDKTVEVVNGFIKNDTRIQLINQQNKGVSAARNAGLHIADSNWILFLDADDWIAPQHLSIMTDALAADTSLDAVHCGWSLVSADGVMGKERYGATAVDLFPVFAVKCSFAIHACIVRKSVVIAAGGFDASLSVCEDWDLWQRIARGGAAFGAVKQVLAFYKMRPHSLSSDGNNFFAGALKVLSQGFAPDNRLKNVPPHNYKGQSEELLSANKFTLLSYAAGLLIGEGKDTISLFHYVKEATCPQLEAYWVAENLLDALMSSTNTEATDIYKFWPRLKGFIDTFLTALEAQTGATHLRGRTTVILERMVLQQASLSAPILIGATYGMELEITDPIETIIVPHSAAERLYAIVKMEGVVLDKIELPITDGLVWEGVWKDAIAAKWSWKILGQFFYHTIYSKGEEDVNKIEEVEAIHNEKGWELFLQQLWNRPGWQNNDFYDETIVEENNQLMSIETDTISIEISDSLPDVSLSASHLNCHFTVGGLPVGSVTLPVENNTVSAQQLRVAIATKGGFELCRVCVKEGLLGQPLQDPSSLNIRLQKAYLKKQAYKKAEENGNFDQPLLLTNRYGNIGSTVSRTAVLPSSKTHDLKEMIPITRESIVPVFEFEQHLNKLNYLSAGSESEAASIKNGDTVSSIYGRQHFETLFTKNPDPWKYTHPYEQTKYDFTISLFPKRKIVNALEIACAEGHFTEQFAPLVQQLIAADISKIALERAAKRCNRFENIRYQHLDLIKDVFPTGQDLIVCSEVLYYVGAVENIKLVAAKMAAALKPGGSLVMAHAHQIIDEPDKPGFDWNLPFGAKVIGEVFAADPLLELEKEIITPLYRVQLFKRKKEKNVLPSWLWQKKPIVEIKEQPTPVPPEVESTVRWQGGTPYSAMESEPVTTKQLPILMYHRVAPSGSDSLSRYRVTPEAFEEQLSYLKDSGYYSVSWSEWTEAVINKKPLTGLPIALTFDDGYQDFYDYAWPLLKKYGFTATVFLVANQIGGANIWDGAYGEKVPLMKWKEIKELAAEGVVFGSHSLNHKPMTALTPAEIVEECVVSRSMLQKELGVPVTVFAYPYGDVDPVVAHLTGGCGYTVGVSCKEGLSQFADNLMSLSRVEVKDTTSLQEFINNLS